MKKVFNSFYVLMLLFLSSCASNENVDTTPRTGELVAKINFSQAQGTRVTNETAESTAIPITNWSNVKDLQLFLYDSSNGKVAFSKIFQPDTSASGSTQTFKFTNVPVGTYKLALVANIDAGSTVYKIQTTLNGTATVPDWVTLTTTNVLGKSLTTPDIYAGLATTSFPPYHTWNKDNSQNKAYSPPSEIFTAYSSSDVVVKEGKTTPDPANNDGSSATNLLLTRAISLMRVRVNKEKKTPNAPQLDLVDFKTDKSFIVLHRLPKGLKLDGTGVLQDSEKDNIMIGATGTTTFNDENPKLSEGYSIANDHNTEGIIIKGDYKLWKDIFVLPTTTSSTDETVLAHRKYFIVIAGWAKEGYKYADGTSAAAGGQVVYWWGTINEAFSPNVIREVNLNITSPGSPTNPTDPDQVGILNITVGAPEPWNKNIVSETIEL